MGTKTFTPAQLINVRSTTSSVQVKIMRQKTTLHAPFTFKLTEYTRKINIYESPHFYSHNGGHKMSVVVDVHGVDEGTGTHISVFVYMASDGQFDALEFPFKGTVTI